tara:strand:- start:989 stop:1426 length:438 start_codon:yes stop_codon:yes gene_type:complete
MSSPYPSHSFLPAFVNAMKQIGDTVGDTVTSIDDMLSPLIPPKCPNDVVMYKPESETKPETDSDSDESDPEVDPSDANNYATPVGFSEEHWKATTALVRMHPENVTCDESGNDNIGLPIWPDGKEKGLDSLREALKDPPTPPIQR